MFSGQIDHYMMINGSIHQENITIINLYLPNVKTPKSITQIPTKLKGKIHINIVIVGGFNTPVSAMDGSPRQIIKKHWTGTIY